MGVRTQAWKMVFVAMLAASGRAMHAEDPKQIVQQAVNAELAANRADDAHWRYVETEMGGNKYIVVETEHGALKRHIEEGGKPLPAEANNEDLAAIQRFIHDPSLQAKQKRDGAHDEKDAEELLNLLPQAFVWKIESETPTTISLAFQPDPNFHPPDMEARVMGEMAGTLVVDKSLHRIKTMKGALTQEIDIGFGILGKLRKGGTFDIERREVAPGLWEVTESRVHIDGRALFFKTIGQQQDELKFEFTRVPPGTTLEQAVGMLDAPAK